MSQKSYGLLEGKKGIVFGPLDETSLGWQIALSAHREGAKLAISNVAVALRVGSPARLAKLLGDAPLISCDVSNSEEISTCFEEAKAKLGQLDFIVHSVGMSHNIRKGLAYESSKYDWFLKTLDVSGLSLHRLIHGALEHDALADGASVIGLSYIAAQRAFTTYSDMADAKALLESVMRSFGARLGPKRIRVNTVSQGPTWTRAGNGIDDFDKMYEYADLLSPLGNPTAQDCGDYVVTLLSDLSRMVTMQNLFHDGGFASMGMITPLLHLIDTAAKSDENLRNAGFSEEMIHRIRNPRK
ncbi:MAG: enoyl-ACP reductase [Bacteroidota bacterium]|nr:enoyl-ACP reductase [Bacteroidota bacterium]MDP4233777.1 enoyl-ACP reductase [Bacteroidota bacterium]MDP4242416.1 enoyl-ACP reductase [Bacteroidota bacterium]MDP4287538.1 enoyl-ACP reductase [Bacteroidota bacterium]